MQSNHFFILLCRYIKTFLKFHILKQYKINHTTNDIDPVVSFLLIIKRLSSEML